jgi:hypothetical protein
MKKTPVEGREKAIPESGSSEEDYSRGSSKEDSRGSRDDSSRRLSKEDRPVVPSGKTPRDIKPVTV